MDILFINAQEKMSLQHEVNGQLLLGTLLLQAGFDVDILRFCQIDGFKDDYKRFVHNAVRTILQREPKAVSFYSLWPDYHIMLRIARELKAAREDIYVVFGGPQASATALETMKAMSFIDAICTGEGEMTAVPFFTALLRSNAQGLDVVPGLYYRENGQVMHHEHEHPLCDLNTLPRWDDRLYLHHYKDAAENWGSDSFFMPIDAGRGCPYSCTFCCTSYFWRRTYRLKSPERIVEDIQFFYNKFGIKRFWFAHDAFTADMRLVDKLCDYIIEKGLDITWKCTTRIDRIDKDLILKMKRAGLVEMDLGVETGSERMQKLINKNLRLNMINSNIQFLLEQEIRVGMFFMYGFPEETEQDLFDTVQLALDLLDRGVRHVSMAFCRFNPTTQITEQFFDQLMLNPKIDTLSRDIYAYADELETIANNKPLFTYYYNLETQLREKYQYLIYFLFLYEKFSFSARYLRQVFGGDAGKLVCALFDANRDRLTCGIKAARQWFRERPLELLYRTLEQVDCPQSTQLKALMQFDFDKEAVLQEQDNCAVVKEYAFCYADLKRRLPIAEYGEGVSKIMLQKKDGKLNLRVLKH